MEQKGTFVYKIFLTRFLRPKESFRAIEARRFSEPSYLNYQPLKALFELHFPSLKNTPYSIHWLDNDGDYICVTSDDELLHAKELLGTPPLFKFIAKYEDEVRGVVHEDVSCDSCGMESIIGHRYECVQCENYDLCRACEHRGVHDMHNMRRHVSGRRFFLTGKVERPQPRPGPPEPSWRA